MLEIAYPIFCRRIAMLVIGMEFATFGISLTAVSNIGTTPISTVPYVLSKIFSALIRNDYLLS